MLTKEPCAKFLNTGQKWEQDKTGYNVSERLNQSHNAEIVMMLGPATKIVYKYTGRYYVNRHEYKHTNQASGPRGKFIIST